MMTRFLLFHHLQDTTMKRLLTPLAGGGDQELLMAIA